MRKYSLLLGVLMTISGCLAEKVPDTQEILDKRIVLTDQASGTVRIYDQPTRTLLWEWAPENTRLFKNPDEAKPVIGTSCILLTAGGGGVAIVRIEDKTVLFQASPKGNPHSAELLPGNLVVTASSDGYLCLYDFSGIQLDKVTLPMAHGVVWDKKRECLWAIGESTLCSYQLSGTKLVQQQSINLPTLYGHDLFPIYEKDLMFASTPSCVYVFDPENCSFQAYGGVQKADVKSISSGPNGFPTICTVPTESWWTEEVLYYHSGVRAFHGDGLKIYKARWMVDNVFSY